MSEAPLTAVPEGIGNVDEMHTVELSELLETLQGFRKRALRFITGACLDLGDEFEILYFFDDQLKTVAVQTRVSKGQPLPTITGVYLCAFLVENEMQDLFGIEVDGLQIDYKGKFLVTDEYDVPPLLKSVSCELKGDKP